MVLIPETTINQNLIDTYFIEEICLYSKYGIFDSNGKYT